MLFSNVILLIYLKANCIPNQLYFRYNGVDYSVPVTLNSYYPTYGSMFSVYLGLHDKTSIENSGSYSAPTVKMNVAEQRIVKMFYFQI